jgi:hypothetical protein
MRFLSQERFAYPGNGQNKIEKLKIPYASNQVGITFSLGLWKSSRKRRIFLSKQEGFDNRWSNSGPQHENILSRGDYHGRRLETVTGPIWRSSCYFCNLHPILPAHFLAYLFYIWLLLASIFIRTSGKKWKFGKINIMTSSNNEDYIRKRIK